MKHPARSAKAPSPRTGLLATLSSLLGDRKSGAPSSRRPKLFTFAGAAILATLILGVSLASGAAPTVTIEAASAVRYTTATVKGEVDPADHETSYRFQYATEPDFSNAEGAGFGSLAEGSGPTPVEAELTELRPNTTYHLRLLAENSEGETSEAVAATFTTKAVAKPTVSIEPVTTFTGATAHFVGHINPNSPEPEASTSPAEQEAFRTFWHFQCTPGCSGLEGELEADDTSHEVSADASGLLPGTLYEVTLVAKNRGGEETAGPVSFTTAAIAPTVDATYVSGVTPTTATLNAEIRPGGALTDYHFEYVSQHQFELSGFQGAQSVPVADTALPGINSRQELVSPPETVETFVLTFEGESTSAISSHATAAELQAALEALETIGAGNVKVTGPRAGGPPWIVEFTGALSGMAVPPVEGLNFGHILAEGGPPLAPGRHLVSARVEGLQASTSYAFRVVASNEKSPIGGTVGDRSNLFTYSNLPASSSCPNEALRTENTSLALPDCRAYERASSSEDAEAFPLEGTEAMGDFKQLSTGRIMRSSPDGNAVTFAAAPAKSGLGEGTGGTGISDTGDQYVSRRTSTGWTAEDIAPSGRGYDPYISIYEAFNEGLTSGVFRITGIEPQLPGVEERCSTLYLRSLPSSLNSSTPFMTNRPCGEPFVVGTANDGSDVLFETFAAKTATATEGLGGGHENIYDFSAGELHLVNVLPNGVPVADASAGALTTEGSLEEAYPAGVNSENAISSDGKHVFWTDLETGIIYVRDNPTSPTECAVPGEAGAACTRQVSSGSATYQAATPDGHYVYYTEAEQLWRFDTGDGSKESLTAADAGVRQVIGLNRTGEDGSYLYFVASGGLAPGADPLYCPLEGEPDPTNADGSLVAGEGCHIYLLHNGAIRSVAVVSPQDNSFEPLGQGGAGHGIWRPLPATRASQVSADGRSLAFMSTLRLTDYENVNRDGRCGSIGHLCTQIYLFQADAAAGEDLNCLSCTPSGAPPLMRDVSGIGTYLPFNKYFVREAPRYMSGDGSRVFFDTTEALIPSDTNEQQDVYQWERPNSGSCTSAVASPFNGGCVSLLSDGSDPEFSTFIASDPSGANVFLVSRGQLTPGDRDGKTDVFDARVNGGFPAGSLVTPCQAEACRGSISAPPNPPSPGTSKFKAFEAPPPKSCKHGVLKHGKCVRRHHHHRRRGHKHGPTKKSRSERKAGK